MHLLNYPAAWYLNNGLVTERVARSAHPFIAPSQLYRTKDGWIFVMAQTQRFWEMLADALGRGDLKATYPDFAARREHRDALTKILDAEFGKRTTAQWLDALRGTIPCGPVYDMAQALENPYFLERGGVQVFDHPDQPGLKLVASPFRIGEPLPANPAPKLGEHTDALLEELGYGAADIAPAKKWFIATTVLGASFISSQILAWLALSRSGLYVQGNPYAGFFYILTMVHAVHVLGGIAALGSILLRTWRPARIGAEISRSRTMAQVIGWYWHLIGALWLVLLFLLGYWK
jgi:hypothetical protein